MIYVPIAAPIPYFKWQISLFEFTQRKIFGDIRAFQENLILIVDRNDHKSIIKDVNWNLRIPYKIVKGIHSVLPKECDYKHFVVGNVFFALKEIVEFFDEEQNICIIDADIISLKEYNGILPLEDHVVTCNYYENWHMNMCMPYKNNYNIIEKYLRHKEHNYMDGGFVPIIIKIKTLKKILDEVIDITIKIVKEHGETHIGWWSQMFAFQIACHNNKIKCIGQDNTYFPGINELDSEKHFFAHYSCDRKIFSKENFPNINIKEFPDDIFYNTIKEWFYR